jgi:predicted RNase H-like HicB family nuclease
MIFTLEFDREDDGRWIAEVLELPGVLAYGTSRLEVKSKVEALARSVLEERANLESS